MAVGDSTQQKVIRPGAVTFAGWFIIIVCLASLTRWLYVLYQLTVTTDGQWYTAGGSPTPALTDLLLLLVRVVFLLVIIVCAVALLRMRPWAWATLMAVMGIYLLYNLLMYLYGEPDYLLMLVGTLVVFALSQAAVQEAFGVRRTTRDQLE